MPRSDSKDWYYAIGRYWAWGEGRVSFAGAAGGKCRATLRFTYTLFDVHDWDPTATYNVESFRIPGYLLERIHRTRVGRNFDVNGQTRKTVSWLFRPGLLEWLDVGVFLSSLLINGCS